MNTHDIELPEPKYPGTKADIPNAIPDLYTADQLRAAIEADRKHSGESVAYHPCTPILIEGLKRLPGGSAILAEWDKSRSKVDAPQPAVPVRGEPVAGYTMVPVEPTQQMIAAFRSGFQNELHKNDRRRTMSAEEAGLRAMLKATPQPAEPVKHKEVK